MALAIGDVVGRGIEAASTMGQMRSALRAILMQADDTGKMADRLNRFTLALGSDEAIMTTVVLAILEPGTGTLRFTNAGHPPPLLVGADGSAAYLDEPPSPPMGVLATPRYQQHTTRLEPGATLVLYTDGLVEEPTEVLDVGLERLRSAATATGTDVEAACELLLDSLSDDTARSDDVTLLVVRLQETLGATVSLEVSNESGGLFTMRQTLRRWLGEQGADADETEDAIMACNEACENAVEHGYDFGDDLFAVEFAHDDGEISISVRDHGTWREPQETTRPRPRPAAHAQADGRRRSAAATRRHDGADDPPARARRGTAAGRQRPRARGSPRLGRTSSSATSRSLAIVWRRIRETCIWLIPIAAPISRLRHVLLEAHAQHLARARRDLGHQAIELGARLGALDVGILGAERVLQRHRVAGLALGRVQRQRAAGAARLHRLEDRLVADADGRRELARRRASGRAPGSGASARPRRAA